MKISYYILIGFLFILILFSLNTYINYQLSENVTENADFYTRSTDILRNSNRFQRNILIMVSGLHGYLLTGEKSFIQSYDNAYHENDQILKILTGQVPGSSSLQGNLLKQIKTLNDKWTDEYTDPLKQAKMYSNVSAVNLENLNRIYRQKFATGDEADIQQKLREKFKQFSAYEYALRDQRKKTLTNSVKQTKTISFMLNVISVIIALLVIRFLIYKITRRIKKMTNMANRIAAGNYNIKIDNQEHDELTSLGYSLNHMAEELSKSMNLLKRSNEELDQFAHIVSHDLKSPLRGISNIVSWIEEDHQSDLSPQIQDYVSLIKERITWAENLIEGLLSYARTHKQEVKKEDVDLNLLIREVMENLPYTGIDIQACDLPVLHTEKLLLYQVFSNLISNGIKYNDKVDVKISINAKEHLDTYEFLVEDNGIGIEEEYYTRIFAIFQTLRDIDHADSTGVGLAIVKKILDNKKQTIKVWSEPGKGSVFAFHWPKN